MITRPAALLTRGDRVTVTGTDPDGQTQTLTLTVFDLDYPPTGVRLYPRQADLDAGAPRWVEVDAAAWVELTPALAVAGSAGRLL